MTYGGTEAPRNAGERVEGEIVIGGEKGAHRSVGKPVEGEIVTGDEKEVSRSVGERVEGEIVIGNEKEAPRSARERVEGEIVTDSGGEVVRVVGESEVEEKALDVDENQSMRQEGVLGFLVGPEYHAGVGVLESGYCGDPDDGHRDLSRCRWDGCGSESYCVCDDVYRYGCGTRLSFSNSRKA